MVNDSFDWHVHSFLSLSFTDEENEEDEEETVEEHREQEFDFKEFIQRYEFRSNFLCSYAFSFRRRWPLVLLGCLSCIILSY